MKTIILPGFSVSNKIWAHKMANSIDLSHEVNVHEWKHWSKGGSLSLPYESDQILDKIGKNKVSLIAKSVGTRVSMFLLKLIPNQISKLILCGIPSQNEIYNNLSKVDANKVIVFQNEKDPLGNFADVEKFIHKINPKIKVIKTPRSDHSYPYPEKFTEFLTSS